MSSKKFKKISDQIDELEKRLLQCGFHEIDTNDLSHDGIAGKNIWQSIIDDTEIRTDPIAVYPYAEDEPTVPFVQMPFICDRCGGNSYTETEDGIQCEYCGTKYIKSTSSKTNSKRIGKETQYENNNSDTYRQNNIRYRSQS